MTYRHSLGISVLALALVAVLRAAPSAIAAASAPPPAAPADPGARSAPPPRAADAPLVETVIVRPRDEPRWRGERIDLSLRDADLVEVLRSFARLGGFNLVIDPSVEGRVTVELQDVPWDAALVVILRTHGLGLEVDGRLVSVSRPSRLRRP